MAIQPPTVPKMRVQRMGKLWRIVYDETRTLARFGDGQPVDGGGYADEYVDGKQCQDGQIAAMRALSEAIAQNPVHDHEEENLG